MITEKNKEEIEKIKDELDFCLRPIQECIFCQIVEAQRQERIKTSIQWCEWILEEDVLYDKEEKQLRKHLNWLKEQDKEL